MALAMAAVGALAAPALASAPLAPESTAAVSTAAFATPLPAWGWTDPHHRTDPRSCQQGGGHEWWDQGHHHRFCRGGHFDQYWY